MLFPVDPSMLVPHLTLHMLAVYAGVGCVVAIAAAWRPPYALAVLLAVIPFDYGNYEGLTFVTLPKVGLACMLVGTIAFFARSPRARRRLRRAGRARMLIAALALLAAATAISWWQADFSFAVRDELVKLREYAGYFFAALAAGIADDDIRPFHLATLLTLGAVAGLAAAQEFTGSPSVVAMGRTLIPRVAGALEGPNQLAGYLQIMIPLLAAIAVARSPAVWDLVVLALAAACDVLTLSRNGIACGIVAVAIVLVLVRGKRVAVATALGLGAVCGCVVRPELFGRLSSLEESANAGGVGTRSVLWKAAFDLWRAHPLLGIGAGNFEFEIGRVGPSGIRTHANDWYLEALVDGGVPLFCATVFVVYAAIASFAADLRRDPIVAAAFAASIGLALASVLDYTLFYPKVSDMWWLLLGAASARRCALG